MRAYKRVIDEGFAATYGEGRSIERRAAAARGISAEEVAARRRVVQERGRAQSN
jgi:enoyl-CoA hydratase